jgi:hypothetical protein
MTTNQLIRWSGLSAMAAGILFIVIQIIHPSDVLSSVSTDRWAIVHILATVMALLALCGLTGLYARQVNKASWLGLVGYLVYSLFWALTMAFQFIEAFVSPTLATESPAFVEGLLAIAGGKTIETDMGSLPEVYAVTGGLYVLGGLTFGIATFRAGILPRLAASSLSVAVVLPIVGASVPHPYDRMFAVPVGIALAWLGYALWAEREEPATATVADTGNTVLSQAAVK